MKYNLKGIMQAAWRLFRKGIGSFSVALRTAWANAKAIVAAATGITEETHTWYGWKQLGREVLHGSKALYQVTIIDPATKSGTRTTSYFGLSQVQQITT